MTDWTPFTARARSWFEHLRDSICVEFEAIEAEAGSSARFAYTPWLRDAEEGEGGGGVQGLMKGKVFEKVGVNVSTVHGAFSPAFAASINGVCRYVRPPELEMLGFAPPSSSILTTSGSWAARL